VNHNTPPPAARAAGAEVIAMATDPERYALAELLATGERVSAALLGIAGVCRSDLGD
jgi:hypothetical protein